MTKSLPAALILIGLALVVYLVWIYHRPASDLADIEATAEQAQLSEPLSAEPPRSENRGAEPQSSSTRFKRNALNSGVDDGASTLGDAAPGSREPAGDAALAEPDLTDPEEIEELVIGGTVIDEEGHPLSGIEVLARHIDSERGSASSFDQTDVSVLSVISDSDGAFLFRDLEDGAYQLRVAPAYGIAPSMTTVRVGPLNVKLVVVFQWDLRVHGIVSSAAGKPLEKVQVTSGRQSPAARTGTRGEYQFDASLQGYNRSHSVHFRLDGYRDQRQVINPRELDYGATELRLDVTMEPITSLTTVTGSLTDTEGRAVPGKTLTLASSRFRTRYQARSDAKGQFAFRKVEPGSDYRLQIRPGASYKNKDIKPLEIPRNGLRLDIVLDPSEQGELSGWMVDLDGKGVPGFALKLHSKVVAGKSVRVVGDQQGFFSVEDFPVGEAMLSSNSYPIFSIQGIRVPAQSEDPIMVILDTGPYVLEGWVIDSQGDPVAANSVLLGWTHNEGGLHHRSSRKTAADQEGYFVFTDLGPGPHRMWVNEPGFKAVVMDIDIGIEHDDVIVKMEEMP